MLSIKDHLKLSIPSAIWRVNYQDQLCAQCTNGIDNCAFCSRFSEKKKKKKLMLGIKQLRSNQ